MSSTRRRSVWPASSSQGGKLTATDESGAGHFGWSVALSADGSTAVIGGTSDVAKGAAWVFARSGSAWAQQGGRLTAPDGSFTFGHSVALSADGSTALIGGNLNSITGGAWVFTRSGSTWAQQGGTLTGPANFGDSVALSADGSTALIGDPENYPRRGAVWVFARSGSAWAQQGGTLTGDNRFGQSVALSADGNTALVGDISSTKGAAWVFSRSAWLSDGREGTRTFRVLIRGFRGSYDEPKVVDSGARSNPDGPGRDRTCDLGIKSPLGRNATRRDERKEPAKQNALG